MSFADLFVDPPAQGAWNMAIDQAILEYCEANSKVVLRFYEWHPATLSLGYFQRYQDCASHPPSRDLHVVRRATGGGAIVHDHELTYSLCFPSSDRWSLAHRDLYDSVHRAIASTLATRGILASLFSSQGLGEGQPAKPGQTPGVPFLCFQRRSPGDLIVEGHKIGGSAQRRGKKALLQHGSILFRRSDQAPELPGIEELSGQTIDPTEFREQLQAALELELAVRFLLQPLQEGLMLRASEIESEVFAAESWTRNR